LKKSSPLAQRAKRRKCTSLGSTPALHDVDAGMAAPGALTQAAEQTLRERLRVNLRAARRAAGMSQKVAAQRGGIHWRHWQKIEAGEVNVSLQTVAAMTVALQLDVSALFAASVGPESFPALALPSPASREEHPGDGSLPAVAGELVERWRTSPRHPPPGIGALITKLEIAIAVDSARIAALQSQVRARTLAEVTLATNELLARIGQQK
jgi:DNA-binding XRE family transcriptional regulator